MKKRTSKFLYIVISMIFIVYLLVLLRVILFKDAPLYNLFAGIGIGARALNLIPFASMIDMITDSTISLIRLAQNIMGNIVLFIPLGIFLPLLYKRNNKAVLLSGVRLSLLFEIVQFIFAIGSSDIDDIILNVLGTIAGLYIYRIIERILHNRIQILVTAFVLFLIMSVLGFGILLTSSSNLFKYKPTERIVRNEQIIKDTEGQKAAIAGKIKKLDNVQLTVEGFVSSVNEEAEVKKINVIPETKVILANGTEEFFFSTLVKETTDYSILSYKKFKHNFNQYAEKAVKIWSKDGINADSMIIFIWND